MYRVLFKLVLRRLDPELAHRVARRALRNTRATRAGRAWVRRLSGEHDPRLRVDALGLTFATPLGISAGVDKDASWFQDLDALGFGHVEVGTLTSVAQEGNPSPRVIRFPEQRALLNRMGFPNPGAVAAAPYLRRRRHDPRRARPDGVVGVNIGKSMVAPLESAGADLRAATRELAPVADYLAINVSSPNTSGLRALQATDALRPLVGEIQAELTELGVTIPLLIKIAPDLDDGEVRAIADLALELGIDGIIAVNTTADRSLLTAARSIPFAGGGVSGPPLRARALEVLRLLRASAGDRLVLISVGGIETAEDVWERILAGASLVQVYTAFVYGGPGWPGQVNRRLAEMLEAAGVASVQELIGAGSAARVGG